MSDIDAYREANADALYSAHHPRHAAAVEGLNALYVATFPDNAPAATPAAPAARSSAPVPALREPAEPDPANVRAIAEYRAECADALADPLHPAHANAVATLQNMTALTYSQDAPADVPAPRRVDPSDIVAMTSPATSAHDYSFKGAGDAPATTLIQGHDGAMYQSEVIYDPAREDEVRAWMFGYKLTPAEARQVEGFYLMEMKEHGFTTQRCNELYDISERELINEHKERWRDVLAAAKRVYAEAPAAMREYLEDTGFGNHPVVVGHFVKEAKRKGYFA